MTIYPFFGNIASHTAEPLVLLRDCGWTCQGSPHFFGSLLSDFGFFLTPMSYVLSNVGHCAVQHDEISLIFNSLASFPLVALFFFASPSRSNLSQNTLRLCHPYMYVHLVWLYGSLFIAIAFCSLSLCHHFVLLHLHACFSVLISAFGFDHPNRSRYARRPCAIFVKISSSYLFGIGTNASWYLFPIPQLCPRWLDSRTFVRFHRKIHCRHATLHPPRQVFASVNLQNLSTKPCLHFACFLPSSLASSLLD